MKREDAAHNGSGPEKKSLVPVLLTEASVYGVLLVSGLIVVTSRYDNESWDVFVRVMGTVSIFWAAHVYSGVVAHMGDYGLTIKHGLGEALRESLRHSMGMLLAALIPLFVLLLGAVGAIAGTAAYWYALWADVIILAVLGYLGVARVTPKIHIRLLGALITSMFGIALVVLKVIIH